MSKAQQLPPFPPISVIGRRVKPLAPRVHGVQIPGVNLIRGDEIPPQITAFGKQVLNPVLSGTEATIVPVLNGALSVTADLVRELDDSSRVELMSVPARSYLRGQTSGDVTVCENSIIPEKITNRTVMIVDDILDTGNTMAKIIPLIKEHKPKQIITVFLLRKMISQPLPCPDPDYWLFEVHGKSFVFGFGLDFKETYRHLRFICDANRDLYDKNGYPIY